MKVVISSWKSQRALEAVAALEGVDLAYPNRHHPQLVSWAEDRIRSGGDEYFIPRILDVVGPYQVVFIPGEGEIVVTAEDLRGGVSVGHTEHGLLSPGDDPTRY